MQEVELPITEASIWFLRSIITRALPIARKAAEDLCPTCVRYDRRKSDWS